MNETNMLMIDKIVSSYTFGFKGGQLCMDFANTIEDRHTPVPQERIKSYKDLLAWNWQAHVLTDEEVLLLLDRAAQHSQEAEGVLQQALFLRECLYRIFFALAHNKAPEGIDLEQFNMVHAEVMTQVRIIQHGELFVWGWTNKAHSLDSLLWEVVRSAAYVLTSEQVHMVRVCAAEDCNWMFLDTSKNRSRRWCDMKGCGNRAKVRKHHERKKQIAQNVGNGASEAELER